MAMNSYMWFNERFTYNPKPPTVKASREQEVYQQILERPNWLETTIKPSVIEPAQGYGLHFES